MPPFAPATPVALVTGGAIRVGRAIVDGLVRAGYRVWVHYFHSDASARSLIDSIPAESRGGGIAGVVRADLTDADARQRLVETVSDPASATGGRLDLLVNNAASFERGWFRDRSDEDLERVLALNLVAPLSLIRRCLPHLSPEASIINILDLGAHHPWTQYVDHSVAKAGLGHATRGLAAELAPLRVNAISPGTVAWPDDPRFTQDGPARAAVLARTPLGRIGTLEDVAEAVLYLARARHITGHTLVLDGGRLAGIAGNHA